MFDFNSYDADTRLKGKSLLAASVLGGGAGVLSSVYGSGDTDAVTLGFLGLIVVVAGGHAGGFLGLMVRGLVSILRGRSKGMGSARTEAIMPCLAFGSLLGLVFSLIFANWGSAHWGAGIGAFIGGIGGGLAGENVGIMLRILIAEDDEHATRQSSGGRIELKDFGQPEGEPREEKK